MKAQRNLKCLQILRITFLYSFIFAVIILKPPEGGEVAVKSAFLNTVSLKTMAVLKLQQSHHSCAEF